MNKNQNIDKYSVFSNNISKENFNILIDVGDYNSKLFYLKLKSEYEKIKEVDDSSIFLLFVDGSENSKKNIYAQLYWDYFQEYNGYNGVPVIKLLNNSITKTKEIKKNKWSNNNFILKSSFSIPSKKLYYNKSNPDFTKMIICPLVIKIKNKKIVEKKLTGYFKNIYFRLEKPSKIIYLPTKMEKNNRILKEGFINIINFKTKKISYSENNNRFLKQKIYKLDYGNLTKENIFEPDKKIYFIIRINDINNGEKIPLNTKKILRITDFQKNNEYIMSVIKIDNDTYSNYNISENSYNKKNWEECYSFIRKNLNKNISYSFHNILDSDISKIKYQNEKIYMKQCYHITKIPYRIISNSTKQKKKKLLLVSSGFPEKYENVICNKMGNSFINFDFSFNYKNIYQGKIVIKDYYMLKNNKKKNFYNKNTYAVLNSSIHLKLKKKYII